MSSVWGLVLLVLMCGGLSTGIGLKDNRLKFVSSKSLNHMDKRHYRDCAHVRKTGGYNKSGLYTLNMNETFTFQVECEFTANNSLTVIQKRVYGTLNFTRSFHDYMYGFGQATGDYWMGLNQIYYLTTVQHNTVLTIYIQDWASQTKILTYHYFMVSDASTNFRLAIGSYQGPLVDDLSFNNGMSFATYDRPDHNYCAVHQRSGWWYNYCSYALPNGVYYHGGPYTPHGGYFDGIYWKDWYGYGYSMKFISMSVSHP